MLKISQESKGQSTSLRLEGKLLEPWVAEVALQCQRAKGQGGTVLLDLSEVSFVDEAGASLLRTLRGVGFEITSCSHFVAELLELEMS